MPNQHPNKSWRSSRVLGLAVAASLALSACNSKPAPVPAPTPAPVPAAKEKPAPKPALTVEVESPTSVQLATVLAASGGIYAWQDASIGTEVGGLRVAEVLANVGDKVKKGQLLVRLTDDTVRADVAQQEAAVADARATLAQAEANAERSRTLEASKAVSTQDSLAAQTTAASAKARLQSAQALLVSQQLRLAQAQVYAPDDGTISARAVSVGQVVSGGTELFRFIRQDRLEWRAELPAQSMLLAKQGQTAKLILADNSTIVGRIRQVAPTLDATSRSGLVYVDLPAGSRAKPGMYVSGRVITGKAMAMTVPGSAIVVRDGVSYLMSVDSDSKVHTLKVTTGQRENDRVEIVSGLPDGDAKVRLVVQGAGFLADGDTVQVVTKGTGK